MVRDLARRSAEHRSPVIPAVQDEAFLAALLLSQPPDCQALVDFAACTFDRIDRRKHVNFRQRGGLILRNVADGAGR